MKILVIVGNDLYINSSANLCHIAYIQGLNTKDNDITVLTGKSGNYVSNQNTSIPQNDNIHYIYYERENIIDKISRAIKAFLIKHKSVEPQTSNVINNDNSLKSLRNIKRLLMNKIYYIDWTWIKRASKFSSNEIYDFVISLSTPHASHKVAYNLIKRKNIRYKHYIQIWEDPWTEDLFFESKKKFLFEQEEANLLSIADLIYYVSPITLTYQKEKFIKSADKMRWMPLPYYYNDYKIPDYSVVQFGYFGDFYPHVRNIMPLYEAFTSLNYPLIICGNPENYLESTDNIHVYGRMPIQQLKHYEDSTNILVFICNLHGGQIPGKLYQYSATKKKILFILDGTAEEIGIIKKYYDKFNRYYFCENNAESIRKTVQELLLDSSVNNEVLECFSSQNIVKNILQNKTGDNIFD